MDFSTTPVMTPDKLTDFFVVDVETTGFDTSKADVIEIAAIKVTRDEKDGRFKILDQFDCYVNPEYPLPEDIVKFNEENNTGINDELLMRSPKADEAARRFLDFVGENPVIVGHNIISFDSRFIEKLCMKGADEHFSPSAFTDTLKISREYDNYKKNNLESVFDRSTKRHSAANPQFHTAIADVICTLDALEYLDDKFFTKREPEYEQPSFYEEFTPENFNTEEAAERRYANKQLLEACYPEDLMMIMAVGCVEGVACAFGEDKYIDRGNAEIAFSKAELPRLDSMISNAFDKAAKQTGGISIHKTKSGIEVTGYVKHKKQGLYAAYTKVCPPLLYKDEMLELRCAIDDAADATKKFYLEQDKKRSDKGR